MSLHVGTIGRKEPSLAILQKYSAYKLNVFLLVSAVLLLAAYIFLANFLAAEKYAVGISKKELYSLGGLEARSGLNMAETDIDNLLIFAQKSGMIEAKDVDSIIQDRNFALVE